jgi:UDPglucose 6-dehydrogenase
MNRRQVPRLAELILSRLPERGTAGVMGLSYKPNTEVIEESQGVALAQELLRAGVRVVVYDPSAMENARRVLPGNIHFAASAAECAHQSDVLAITTAWPEFRQLRAEHWKPGAVVLDCWRVLSPAQLPATATYLVLGMPSSSEVALSAELP